NRFYCGHGSFWGEGLLSWLTTSSHTGGFQPIFQSCPNCPKYCQDKTIKNDETVCLKATGTERIFSRLPEKIIIFVNTREKHVAPGKITFLELVKLAFPEFQEGPNTSFTVSYRKGCGERPEGTLIEGESIKITKGMHFNVSATDKS
ncbi:MAG: multiubiquitin domain-containing protein, partial [Thiofilum sp.]|uniref:multiubiquitin domain-containing protein n=1 Tax=Thiofilum sp. TaxID=2212733 RepID=UPI003BB0135A